MRHRDLPQNAARLSCVVFVGWLGVAGCGGSQAEPNTPQGCREGPGDDVAMGAKTAGQGAEAGAETGVAGVKQFGRAVGGWVEGGSDEAEREWEEGEQETIQEANEGSAEVKAESSLPPCPAG